MRNSYDGWNLLLKNIQTHSKKIVSHPKKNVDQLLNSLFTQGFLGLFFLFFLFSSFSMIIL